MRLNIYTIYDTACGAYMRPFFSQSDGEAVRSFSDISLDAEHPIGKHPEDYSLHRIGSFNDQNAIIIPETKECMATALELIALSKNVNQDNMDLFKKEVDIPANFKGNTQ